VKKLINNIDWIEKNEMMDELVNQEIELMIHPMDQGFEAEVMEIRSHEESFVLKVWNKRSKPDIHFQYHLLNVLFEEGLAVSKALGWGTNPNGDKVLLTAFDGLPVLKVNKKKMAEIAKILSSIHRMNVENVRLPTYDFIDYFFPQIQEHQDLHNAVTSLIEQIQLTQEHLIHGDFHLANIIEKNNRYTVIDWTNAQLGDPRYDFAWSLILKKIYISEQYANAFRSTYLVETDIRQKELGIFEALACLRWLLLSKSDGVPILLNTIERVKRLVENNPFLNGLGLLNENKR
jgi:RIO-like serine/threonine protein kinase